MCCGEEIQDLLFIASYHTYHIMSRIWRGQKKAKRMEAGVFVGGCAYSGGKESIYKARL